MKAIDIINFINEDKFSKYTLPQIYDELGKEGFVDYIEQIGTKIVKNMETKTGFNKAKVLVIPEYLATVQIVYTNKVYAASSTVMFERLEVRIATTPNRPSLNLSYYLLNEKLTGNQLSSLFIFGNVVNLVVELRSTLYAAYNARASIQAREAELKL